MIDLVNNTISLDLFRKVLKEIKNQSTLYLDMIDSFSDNQFKSKVFLLDQLTNLGIVNEATYVVIIGCWYGSILIPVLSSKVSKITGIDLDDRSIRIAKNRFFPNYKNVYFRTGDTFDTTKNKTIYSDANLIINTSCEHMRPMCEWPYWDSVKSDAYFAFQSNNMFGIDGHTNCVNSIIEFKAQMPTKFEAIFENELIEDRGIRYTLIGKMHP